MKKPSYAIATIQGRVASKPEHGEWNGKEFAGFTLGVASRDFNGGETEVFFQIRTWSDKLFPAVDSLQPGQGVQVAAQVENKPRKGKDGTEYDNLTLRPLAVVPGLAPAAAEGSGVTSPQRPQQAAHPSAPQGGYAEAGGGNYGGGAYTPQANGREAAQMPHEDEEDIPF